MFFTQQVFDLKCLFFLTPSDTSGSYYFELNISQMLLVKVLFIKKHAILFLSLLGWRNVIAPSLFLCLFGISMGWYWRKNLAKSGGFGKNIKRGMTIWEEFKPSAHNEFSIYPWNAGICKIIGRGLRQLSGFGFPMKFQYSLWFLPCLLTHG